MTLSYTEAAAVVQAEAGQLQPARNEVVPLVEAYGRVLAEPLRADRDQPPFPRATRDGFAARADDWKRGPLTVAGLLRAGEVWPDFVSPGTCVEIMTGAPVPPGADSVAMVEHVERDANVVVLQRALAGGENVVPQGAEARADAVLLPAGTRFNAHGIAAAAACGAASLRAWARPRVAILSTGDELVEIGTVPLPHQIRNSNTHSLAAQVRALGGEPFALAPVADEPAALQAALRQAAASCDLLLISGGVSMGKYDLVEPALLALGGRFHFTGARIQPGKPVVFGSLGALPFFGLPGNPLSTMVCFALFAAPILAALAGERYVPTFAQARLAVPVRNKPGLARFLPASLSSDIEGSRVEAILWQGSGDLAGTASANCFLVVPQESGDLAAGDTVSVLLA